MCVFWLTHAHTWHTRSKIVYKPICTLSVHVRIFVDPCTHVTYTLADSIQAYSWLVVSKRRNWSNFTETGQISHVTCTRADTVQAYSWLVVSKRSNWSNFSGWLLVWTSVSEGTYTVSDSKLVMQAMYAYKYMQVVKAQRVNKSRLQDEYWKW